MKHLYYIIQTLLRGRGGNFVKLTSLTLGLLVGILLFSQIAFELSYENFYKDSERLVMLRMRNVKDGVPDKNYNYGTYRPAATDLWEALPEQVECASLTSGFWQSTLYKEDKKLEEVPMLCVDTLYFHTTGVRVLKGDPHDLGVMQNAFISQSMARRVFGDEDPIGKELSVDKMFNVTIRGIYQDVPRNTILPHEILLSMAVMDWGYGTGTWGTNNIYNVLFRLKQESDVAVMNQRVQKAVEQYTDPHLGESVLTEYSVVPLREIYRNLPDTQRKLVIMGVLGFSIFFVSIMNYVLAAIASMSRRAKTVGVHKCSGAGEGHILGMFLWETGLLIFVSLLACLLLMYFFSDRIEDMLGYRLADLFTWQNLYVPLLTVLLLFVVAGVLPGRMYARIPVTQVFRRYTEGKRSWKRGLLFVQFAGMAFILGMLLTTVWQYKEVMSRNVGFHSQRLAVAMSSGELEKNAGVADAIRRQPYVEAVACSSHSLLQHYSTNRLNDVQGNFICPLHFILIDKDLPKVTGLKLLDGSWPQHIGEAVVGKKTVETMKWQNDVIGRKLPIDPSWAQLQEQPIIVGVVDDVRNMGFFSEQTCTAFILNNRDRSFNVRLKEPVDENLKKLNDFVKEAYPDNALEFTTYQEVREKLNESVSHFRNIVTVTSGCILLIVLLGLIGYVSDETQRRSKEIAVRKVNGAEASSILRMLSIGILKVALGAVVIGIVSSWYVSGIWMQQFPDSSVLSPFWFIIVGICLLALIVLVVVVRAWRIANENPVKSIKSE
ncbi:FtsX-like permease family protein [uncultured Bacteroides sp.]|uniref:ABC transporter permease n=1 Tax=uncultured Bacteroides sp. TaxID=162156 RepID=UPI0025D99BB8|nr:FtsX-like permease family protein [uncultured Bacteroides sp.]